MKTSDKLKLRNISHKVSPKGHEVTYWRTVAGYRQLKMSECNNLDQENTSCAIKNTTGTTVTSPTWSVDHILIQFTAGFPC